MIKEPIDIWRDIELAAEHAKIPKDTFHQWKSRAYVPPSSHHDIVLASVALGGHVTHPILHAMWREQVKRDVI